MHVLIYGYVHGLFTLNTTFANVIHAYLCVWMCVWGCVCVSVWLLSSHVCHLLPLQVAPPRADVVDASSHPAPSPVPRYYHTTHWLMNLLDIPSLWVPPCLCVFVCKCPRIWVGAGGSVSEGLIYHYLVVIYCSYHDLCSVVLLAAFFPPISVFVFIKQNN